MNLEEARPILGKLVRRAAAGEQVVIHVRGVPTARLVPYRELVIEAGTSDAREGRGCRESSLTAWGAHILDQEDAER